MRVGGRGRVLGNTGISVFRKSGSANYELHKPPALLLWVQTGKRATVEGIGTVDIR